MKEKTLVLISIMSVLFVHLMENLKSACKIMWQTCCRSCWLFTQKWQMEYFCLNPSPPFLFKIFSQRVFRSPNLSYRKGNTRKERKFLWNAERQKTPIFWEDFSVKGCNLLSKASLFFYQLYQIPCLRSCSTLPPLSVQMETYKILQFLFVYWILKWF